MAQQVIVSQMGTLDRAARNADHASLGGYVHNDGPEWSGADPPVEQVLPGSSPTTASAAGALILAAKAFINLHFAYADTSNGDHIFAHNVADGANVLTATMDAWSTIESALRGAVRSSLNDTTAKYELHRLNTGGAWHTTVDTVNSLGGPLPSDATDLALADRANLLKALLSDHVVKQGGTHTSADTGNVVATANAVYDSVAGMDWDKMIALCAALKTKLDAHRTSSGIHAVDDTVNATTVAAPILTTGWNTLCNEILTKWDLHVVATAYHNFADGDNALALGAISTVAGLISAAQAIFTKVVAHVRSAPLSRAIRLVS